MRITPSVGASETYTTNVNLATGNAKKKSDLISTVNPAVAISATGGRANLNLNYGATLDLYKRESGRDDLHHNLTASGTAELWQRQLFFDANAAIFRQVINPSQATSATPGVSAVNAADTASFQAGPRFLHHFGPYVDTVSTITYSLVDTSPTNAANASGTLSAPALTAANASTRSTSTTFRASSGRAFTRVLWSATAQETKTGRGDIQPGVDSKNANVNLTYVINRKYALLGGVGWQDIQDSTLTQAPVGITWNVGVRLTPGPRTSFTLNFNDRDNSQFFSFNGSYRLSSRTTVTVSYDEALTFSQQQVASALPNLVFINGVPFDVLTGLPFNPANQNFTLQTQTSRTTTFTAALSGTRGRNQFTVLFSHADQNTDLGGMQQTTNNGSVQWSRTINRRLNGSLAFNVQTTDQQPTNVNNTRIVGSLSLNYALTPTASASLTANTSRLDSSDPTQNTNETSITLGLRKRF